MNIGDKITYKGFEWIVLDMEGDTVTCIMSKFWKKDTVFDSSNNNNWETSSIRKTLQEDLLPVLGEENLITHTTDLIADNGDKRYGTCEDKVWLLSCDEYRKYRETILSGFDFDDEWMWTVTPWWINDVGYGYGVRTVTPTGGVFSSYLSYAINSHGVAPACIFHLSSPESAPIGAEILDAIRELKERVQKLEAGLADDRR